MWTCRNCNAENPDELKVCAACGEKNVTPPKGAEVKQSQAKSRTRDNSGEAVKLLLLAAKIHAIASGTAVVCVLIAGTFAMRPLLGLVVAAMVAAGAVPLYAILKGMAVIIKKL